MSDKQYGLVIGPPDENAYVLGAIGGVGTLPRVVLQPNRDWTPYLPKYEPQAEKYETWGCTVFGSQNCIETLMARLISPEILWNYSERFNYIIAGIREPGADPHYVIETIREHGLVANALLPMADTYKEFLTPDPMIDWLLEEGLKFPFEVKHEYVWKWGDNPSKEERTAKIREALQYSPLGITVTAWNMGADGTYIDNGQPNNHWCMLFCEQGSGWMVFDSYDNSIKTLSFDHKISMAKRFHLEPSNRLQQVSLLKKALALLRELFVKIKTGAWYN